MWVIMEGQFPLECSIYRRDRLLAFWSYANLELEYIKQQTVAGIILGMFATPALAAVIHGRAELIGLPESCVSLLSFTFRL